MKKWLKILLIVVSIVVAFILVGVIWGAAVTAGLIFGFYYLDNRWLNHGEE